MRAGEQAARKIGIELLAPGKPISLHAVKSAMNYAAAPHRTGPRVKNHPLLTEPDEALELLPEGTYFESDQRGDFWVATRPIDPAELR